MSNTKLLRTSKDSNRLKVRAETLEKLRREVRRIASNGTMQGQRYANLLVAKYPELQA
jgi:hypothetical protein